MNPFDGIEKQIDQKFEQGKEAIILAVEVAMTERAMKAQLQWLMTANPAKQAKYQVALDALA